MPLTSENDSVQIAFVEKRRLLFDTSAIDFLIRTKKDLSEVEQFLKTLEQSGYKIAFSEQILLELGFGPESLQRPLETELLNMIKRVPVISDITHWYHIENGIKPEPQRYRIPPDQFETFAVQHMLRKLMDSAPVPNAAQRARTLEADARIAVCAHNHGCILVTENKKDFELLRSNMSSVVKPPIISVTELWDSLSLDILCN